MAKGKKKRGGPNAQAWLTTYSDMVTLMLCFFVIFFNPDEITQAQLDAISTSMRTGGIGMAPGGLTLAAGRSAELGNTIMQLPSLDQGRWMGTAVRRATSIFSPEIRSNKVRVTRDERGLVITLAGDAFFNSASARINIEATRDIMLRIGTFISSDEMRDEEGQPRKIRIEGHSDEVDVDPNGPWEDNWQLSVERSRAVLNYLAGLGVDEKRFQIAGFGSTVPLSSNDTPEGRANNRRVDIVILDRGHL